MVTSAFLFGVLSLILVGAQFRSRQEGFTLVEVASALAELDVPSQCANIKKQSPDGIATEDATWEKKIVSLAEGSVLHMSDC